MKGAVAFALILGVACSLVQARKGFGVGGQEWGFVDVRKGAHMFYWLYYVGGGHDPAGKPLVIWLQGGPGAASTSFGNFDEIGPQGRDMKRREKSWVDYVNVMFVDNPVGTGFSFVDSNDYLSTDNKQIAIDLVNMYVGFLNQNPKFEGVPLYVFCESYGGKMAAEFAYELYKEKQRTNNAAINIRGVGLGDGWISGVDSTVTWAPFLKQYGVLNETGYQKVDAAAQKAKRAAESGNWYQSTVEWLNTEEAVIKACPRFCSNCFYNIYNGTMNPNGVAPRRRLPPYLTLSKSMLDPNARRLPIDLSTSQLMKRVRTALGLPKSVRHEDQTGYVFRALATDFMKPVIHIVEKLLTETTVEVNVYNGEWDLIVDILGTLAWVNRMEWPGAADWKSQAQVPLLVDGQDNGYFQSYGNFTFYSVGRAGHMVPEDNPDAAIAVLKRITHLD